MDVKCYFSIIIPVYKTEEYLHQCVDSILCQTFTDYEIILVDDGSPDNCPAICDEYAAKDNRVIVVHKENSGLSGARNEGLRKAKGKYIAFLDSDDYWDRTDALKELYSVLLNSEADVALIRSRKFYFDKERPEDFVESGYSKPTDNAYEASIKTLIGLQLYDCCAWNKIIKRELTKTGGLFFTEGIISEDLDWVARLCIIAKSIVYIDKPIHIYRKGRKGAITTSLKEKNIKDTGASIIRCLKYQELSGKSELFISAYYNYLAYRYVIWLAENEIVGGPNKKMRLREMKQYRWLLKYHDNKKVKIAYYFNKIMGLSCTSKLLGIYLSKRI